MIAGVVVGVDQLTKAAIAAWLGRSSSSHRVDIVGGVLGLHYVENTGAAFGVLPDRRAMLSVLALLVLGGLVVYYRRLVHRSPVVTLGMGLLVGGALGNIIDRARLGHVIDFIAVGAWPKFNVADSAITIGVLLVAWRAMTASEPSRPSRPPAVLSSSDDGEHAGTAI